MTKSRHHQSEDQQRLGLLEEAISHMEAAVAVLPERCRPHLGNALLNLALGQLVGQYGQAVTAQLLARVQHTLIIDACPTGSGLAIDPFRLHS